MRICACLREEISFSLIHKNEGFLILINETLHSNVNRLMVASWKRGLKEACVVRGQWTAFDSPPLLDKAAGRSEMEPHSDVK